MSDWVRTPLSVDPPIYVMGEHDREIFGFSPENRDVNGNVVNLTIVEVAHFELIDLANRLPAAGGPSASLHEVTSDNKKARFLVHSLRPGQRYQLEVSLKRSDNRTRTMTLRIDCRDY